MRRQGWEQRATGAWVLMIPLGRTHREPLGKIEAAGWLWQGWARNPEIGKDEPAMVNVGSYVDRAKAQDAVEAFVVEQLLLASGRDDA